MNKVEALKKIGLKIKDLREERKISQQDLAAACNFEKSSMSRIEAGRTNLTIGTPRYRAINVIKLRNNYLIISLLYLFL